MVRTTSAFTIYTGIWKEQRVTVKKLLDRLGNVENIRMFNDFRNECEIQSNLSHPNIIKLYGTTSTKPT